MREIKFRAWDKDKQEMISWEELKKTYCLFLDTPNDWLLEVMQYTGLKDARGREIFEGDIVGDHSFYAADEIGVVKFGEFHADSAGGEYGYVECWGWYIEGKSYDWRAGHFKNLEIEVIGNIYENPELLKEDK